MKPLQQLLDAFHSPGRLIQKRTDKLLDYSASSQKAEKNKDASKNRIVSVEKGHQSQREFPDIKLLNIFQSMAGDQISEISRTYQILFTMLKIFRRNFFALSTHGSIEICG